MDGRSNAEVKGVKGLRQLARLKTLVLPLLHLHHTNRGALSALQLCLQDTQIVNVSRSAGQHHGCEWFKCFSAAERAWWVDPVHPWSWNPTLHITA